MGVDRKMKKVKNDQLASDYSDEIKSFKAPKKSFLKYLSTPEVQSWRSLMDAYKAAYNFLDTKLQEDGYNCSRFQIFFLLYFEGPKTATQLTHSLQVTRGNISMFLKRLLKERLVESHRFKNAEAPAGVHYYLSSKGKNDFERIFPKHVTRIQKNMPAMDSSHNKFLMKFKSVRDAAEG